MQWKNLKVLIVFVTGIVVGLVFTGLNMPLRKAQALSSGDNCKQWAVNIMDLPEAQNPEGGIYFLVPRGWEPMGVGIAGTTMRKCIKK